MYKVIRQISVLIDKQFPQSFLIKKPFVGTFVFFILLFLFVVIYKPLHVQGARSFSFNLTMLVYCLIIAAFVMVMALILNRTNCFSKKGIWTIAQEMLSIIIILICIGLSAYFAGFVMEDPGSRWNISTFLDSFFRSVLVGIIPVLFPSLLNIRYAFTPETFLEFKINEQNIRKVNSEELIYIKSKAKKEDLSFYPSQFIYAESEGNYVVFHLILQEGTTNVIIRNSISEIEDQLTVVPFFMRIHRAFIVNLKKVSSKKGNSLGYHIKLQGCNNELPVSRHNTQKFDQLIRQFLLSIHH